MTKQELRAPDAFLKVGLETREWIKAQRGLVIALAVLLVIGGAGAALASYWSNRQEEHAAKDLGLALDVINRPTTEELHGAKPENGQPIFTSSEERDQAIAKSMQDFLDHHGRTTHARMTAELALGDAQLRLGHDDEALKAYEVYLRGTPATELLRTLALQGEGYAYEAKHQYDQALLAFDQMGRETRGDFLAGMGMYHRARILALENKKQDAAQTFQDVETKFPSTTAARDAAARLALLASEGITPAAAPVPALPAATFAPPDAGH